MSGKLYQKIAEVVGAIRDQNESLSLSSLHLSCVAILFLNQSENENGHIFSVQDISDAYERACNLHHEPFESLAKPVTHLIDRFRRQRILTLIDGSDYHAKPEYSLSRLGAKLGEFFSERINIQVESFVTITDSITSKLSEILQIARGSSERSMWDKQVMPPIESVAMELMQSLELRQKSMDEQAERTLKKMADLLEKEWFHAIKECGDLGDEIMDTLHELHNIIPPATQQMEAMLDEMSGLARGLGFLDIVERLRNTENRVQLLSLWSQKSLSTWTKTYRRMHGFIQNVVRTDPNRMVASNLSKQIAGWADNRFYLIVADDEPLHEPSDVDMSEAMDKKRVSFTPVEQIDLSDDLSGLREAEEALLRSRVREALDSDLACLSDVCSEVGRHYPPNQHYALIGRIADLVSRMAVINPEFQYEWNESLGYPIEDWQIIGVLND